MAKILQGTMVTSDRPDKTIVVTIVTHIKATHYIKAIYFFSKIYGT